MLLETRPLEFLDFCIDPGARTLKQGDAIVPITGKAFDLLLYMVENPNRPLLKKELLDAVWPDSFVEESNLTQNVSVLRKALGPEGARIIQTLTGRGYQFVARVTPVLSPPNPEPDPKPDPKAEPAAVPLAIAATETRIIYREETEERVPFWQSPVTLAFASATVILLGLAAWLGWLQWEDHVGGPPVQVLLLDPEGTTGDAVLDRTLVSVMRSDLAQSPFVTVVSAATVRQTMVQMAHKPEEALTPQLAQDLCERTSSQAVLRGIIAHAGSHYILTEEATSCLDSNTLAAVSRQVSRPDDLPPAVDPLAASIRRKLGESRRTIARFSQPLVPVKTESLEALKDFSQASYVAQSGRFTEAIELLKHAVALDPNFGAAYLNLSNFSANALDYAASREYLLKAYALRNETTEPNRLFIEGRYDIEISGDLYQGLRDFQTWIDMYPRSPQPWSASTQIYRTLGENSLALRTAAKMVELVPGNVVAYQALADAQMKTGDFAASLATCRGALSRGFDGENIRFLLLRLGHLTQNDAIIDEQEKWAADHPDSAILLSNEASFAQQAGRMADADRLIAQAQTAFQHEGEPKAAASLRQSMASGYLELGEPERAQKLLDGTLTDPDNFDDLFALAQSGNNLIVQRFVAEQLAAHPQSTVWTLLYAPLLRGEMALLDKNPTQAISALEPTRQLDKQGPEGPYFRGMAFLAARRLPEAEAEFRAILAHPEIAPVSPFNTLAQLQLARVLTLEGNGSAAAAAYQSFLNLWSHPNGNPHLLEQARRELAALR